MVGLIGRLALRRGSFNSSNIFGLPGIPFPIESQKQRWFVSKSRGTKVIKAKANFE